jgi:hypothetical protein
MAGVDFSASPAAAAAMLNGSLRRMRMVLVLDAAHAAVWCLYEVCISRRVHARLLVMRTQCRTLHTQLCAVCSSTSSHVACLCKSDVLGLSFGCYTCSVLVPV